MSNQNSDELNAEQIEAVEHTKGPSVILAGAGSGKTRVLVQKVLHLIKSKSAYPSQILMITFTNKAASEMKKRMGQTTIGYIGTFHSLSARILRIEGEIIGVPQDFAIYDSIDQLSLVKSIIKKDGETRYTPGYYLHRISAAKNELISPGKYLSIFSDYQAHQVASVYTEYQKELAKNKACDFDDLIIKVIELFSAFPEILDKYQDKYRYILVDEFQDTNLAQYVLTKQLAKKYQNITAVGDFSQSIYAWRGADIKNIEKFQKDFELTKMFYLEKNYRSTAQILDFAYRVISKNTGHPILKLHTARSGGQEIAFLEHDNEQDEALFVASEIRRLKDSLPYSSFAVLYRTNAQSRVMEEAFLHYGIPYVLVGGTRFYERREIKDILAYLRLFVNPDDSVAEERIVKLGKRRFSDFKKLLANIKDQAKNIPTVELIERVFSEAGYLSLYNPDDPEDYGRLENIKELKSVALSHPDLTEFLEQVALVESEYFKGEKKAEDENTLKVMTLHGAKGLEFDCVFIVGVEEGLIPHSRSTDDQFQIEEERRLFYVGITRAKERLYITYTKKRFIFGRRNETIRSRFLMEDEGYE